VSNLSRRPQPAVNVEVVRCSSGNKGSPQKHEAYGWGIENGNNFEHVAQEDLIEEVGVAFLQAIKVDILFEAAGFAAQLGERPLAVVGIQEIGRNAGSSKRQRERHDGS
jgi:hypothetical protein